MLIAILTDIATCTYATYVRYTTFLLLACPAYSKIFALLIPGTYLWPTLTYQLK